MKPVKIAILSCNHGHAKGYYMLRDDPFFDLVGVSVKKGYSRVIGLDTIPDVPKYETNEELYAAHPDLEAVIIASDNKSHLAETREAVRRGLHVFSMKIPTFDKDEYREMIRITEEAGIAVQVELEMRHHAPMYRVRDLITEGAVGELLSVNMVNYSHNPLWWRPWQCDPEDSYGKKIPLREGDGRFRGGALSDHPHVFDGVRFLTGAHFDSIYADVAPNLRRENPTEDMVRVIGTLSNGVQFSIDPSYANSEHRVPVQVDWEKYPRCVEVFMTAVGTKGVIVADLYGKIYFCERGKDSEYLTGSGINIGLWNRRMQEFYECVRNGAKPPVGLRDHYETVAAMNAAYESISTGKTVRFTEEDRTI